MHDKYCTLKDLCDMLREHVEGPFTSYGQSLNCYEAAL